jgi:hypothetical protein
MPSEKFWTASASLPGPLRLPRHRRLLMIGTFLSLFAAPRSKCAKFNIPRCRRKINNQVRFEGESRRLDISPPYRKLGGSLAGGACPGEAAAIRQLVSPIHRMAGFSSAQKPIYRRPYTACPVCARACLPPVIDFRLCAWIEMIIRKVDCAWVTASGVPSDADPRSRTTPREGSEE